ncbi:uncharacterized protein C11orf16 homolog [Rhynchonycteris naso]
MESSTEPGMPLPRYCSVATTRQVPAWAHTAPPWGLSFTCPFALPSPWLTWHCPLTRCSSYQPCLHFANPAWLGPGPPGRVGDAADTWVLARRGPDAFYYRARIKTAPELERRGGLLVEFKAPLVTDPELPAQQQSVVLGEDVIRFSPSAEYSLKPGDKVLAPWEADRQPYGPATVLSLEGGDPQRASKEEITVHFWNGQTAAVPREGVGRVPPAVWKKAVERLQRTFTREHPGPLLPATCCCLLAPVTSCVINRLPWGTPFLCHPSHPHASCRLLYQGCLDCCALAGPTWWPLTRTSAVTDREHSKVELEPTPQLLSLEAPKEEEAAVQAPVTVSPSSSSLSEEEDLEKGPESGLAQRLMVDSTVNTDPILLEATPRRQGGLCQPEWRYWRRNGPEPYPGETSIPSSKEKRCCNIQEEEKGDKQQRTNCSSVSNNKLVLEASSMKPLQIVPEHAGHGQLNQGITVTRQRPGCLRLEAPRI